MKTGKKQGPDWPLFFYVKMSKNESLFLSVMKNFYYRAFILLTINLRANIMMATGGNTSATLSLLWR